MIALNAAGTPELGSQRLVLHSPEVAPGLIYGHTTRVALQLPEGGCRGLDCALLTPLRSRDLTALPSHPTRRYIHLHLCRHSAGAPGRRAHGSAAAWRAGCRRRPLHRVRCSASAAARPAAQPTRRQRL